MTYESGDRFAIAVRGHVIHVDQPLADGGEDSAPTPLELFAASLASCVAHYARRFLARHEFPTDGLSVEADWTVVGGPARVGSVDIRMTLPPGVPAERHEALLAMARHCTVHNSLVQAPEVSVTLA